MAFDDDEKSVADSQPIELFEIVTTKGTYRLTSHNANYTYNAQVYTAVPSMRSGQTGASLGDPPEMVITLPASQQVVLDHAFSMPSRSMTLTIYRVQRTSGAGLVWHVGKVTGIAIEGKTAKLRSEERTDAALSTPISSVYFQRLCNHALYDARCAVVRASFDVVTTIAAVSANGRQITVTSDGGNPDQWLKAGEIVRDVDGERRMVIDHTGDVLTIDAPFQTIAIGNAVTLYAGCDHTIETCRDKFANVANFGGTPYIPSGNPFIGDLRGIAVSIEG